MIDKNLKLLLVEDDRIEILKFNRSIANTANKIQLTVANDGTKALEELQVQKNMDVVILDLNMPDTNGIEFLKTIKENEDLKHIPIIILTTSDNKHDILECYRLGIAGYFIKPLKFEDYQKKIMTIVNYCLINEYKPNM